MFKNTVNHADLEQHVVDDIYSLLNDDEIHINTLQDIRDIVSSTIERALELASKDDHIEQLDDDDIEDLANENFSLVLSAHEFDDLCTGLSLLKNRSAHAETYLARALGLQQWYTIQDRATETACGGERKASNLSL